MKLTNGKKYLLVNSAGTTLVKITGYPNTFRSLIRVMGVKSGLEWYERKHLLYPYKNQ